ncbi:phage baseplate assembly protein V [Paenibacillus radicis (ex Gao et al. 2016)]|uniref:Phage tail protein n=1 Tax=Paenibacillus radicis (ex Gao et al. 2016) TaxID=1737354 RepID=A0A917HG73_9BACL|nr:phage baseplate assembly protein V [Paenibacillus radicis (ex Gao et al. 2016)]GGG77817.1 phage tail protein [Paenibacillus radicis (ex Gao et al. 2016)]
MSMMFSGLFDQHGQHARSMVPDQLSGVWNAIVTANNDPDKLGRVKVKFPLREGELQTDWIRVATMMGGSSRGTLFIPEVNDEVLVAFLMGRIDSPIVIGSLWNKVDKPPTPHEKNDIRQIKTRSGHEITFQDTDNDGKITIKTNKGHQIELEEKSNSITVETKDKAQSIVMTGGSSGTVTVKAGGTAKIVMSNQGDVTIEGTKSTTIKGPKIEVDAQASLTLQSGGMLEMKANGMVSIKGSIVKIN